MSDHLPRTNRWLILLSVVLCLIVGGIFTRSSAVTSQADASDDAGVFVSEDQDSEEVTSEKAVTDNNDNFTDDSSVKLYGTTSSGSSESTEGGPALSSDISPEASEGKWASSGSSWMFLVDDKPYTGYRRKTILYGQGRYCTDRLDRYRKEAVLFRYGRYPADRNC